MNTEYDAILIVSFGGPECREDVIPFLENVLRGKNVPRERMLEVAEHYYHFDGFSPINEQVRQLIKALKLELAQHDIDMPVYWGNRNWHPLLQDTVQLMAEDGIKHALAFVTAAYSSYSSCRQYCEDVERACQAVGSQAPQVDKVRVFYNHPDFIAANVDHVREALNRIPADHRSSAHVAYTAHSIPNSMAATCDYERQLHETCRLVSHELGIAESQWELVYQSRSGRPTDPWLEPDIVDHVRQLRKQAASDVIVVPIGFLSDHLEVLFDLDHEAKEAAEAIGLNLIRAATVGTHLPFIQMIRKLICERLSGTQDREAVGKYSANHDVCPADCCPIPMRLK